MTAFRFAPTAAALTALFALGACQTDDPIVIGLAGPFSEARGRSMRLAADLAVAEINETGGILGRRLQLEVKDDSASADAAVRVARELYDDPRVVAVIGHLTSGTTLAAAPIYNSGPNPLVAISPSASSPDVTNAGPYTFRTSPSDLVHGARLAEWTVSALNAQTAAILYHNDDYGRGIRSSFASNFEGLGGTIVSDDPYLMELPSFEPFLQRLQFNGGADVLLIAGARAAAERILPALDSLGLTTEVVAGDGVIGLEGSEVNALGMHVSTAYLPDRAGPRNSTFVNAYRLAYDDQLPDHRGAGAYDIVRLLSQAIEASGTARAAIQRHLTMVGRDLPPYEGVTGTTAFDENGDVPNKEVVIGVIASTGLVSVDQ